MKHKVLIIILFINNSLIFSQRIITNVSLSNDSIKIQMNIKNTCNEDFYIPNYFYVSSDIFYSNDSSVIKIYMKNDFPFDLKFKLVEYDINYQSVPRFVLLDDYLKININSWKKYDFFKIKSKSELNIYIYNKIKGKYNFNNKDILLYTSIITEKWKNKLNVISNSATSLKLSCQLKQDTLYIYNDYLYKYKWCGGDTIRKDFGMIEIIRNENFFNIESFKYGKNGFYRDTVKTNYYFKYFNTRQFKCQ